MFCNNCGDKLSENDAFCGKCGGEAVDRSAHQPSLRAVAQSVPVANSGKSRSRKFWIGPIIAFVCLILLAVAAFSVWHFDLFGSGDDLANAYENGFEIDSSPEEYSDEGPVRVRSIELVVSPRYYEFRLFSEGLAAVRIGDRMGFIDTSGNEVIPLMYDWAESFSEGLAQVREGTNWSFINTEGDSFPIELDLDISSVGRVFNGMTAIAVGEGDAQRWGLIRVNTY